MYWPPWCTGEQKTPLMTNCDKRKHKTRPSALCHYTRTMSNGLGQYRDQNVWCTFSFFWRHVISGTVMDKDVKASNVFIQIEWNPVCMATYIYFPCFNDMSFSFYLKLLNWIELSLILLMPLLYVQCLPAQKALHFSITLLQKHFVKRYDW